MPDQENILLQTKLHRPTTTGLSETQFALMSREELDRGLGLAGAVAREAAAAGVAEIAEGTEMMGAGAVAEEMGKALEGRAKR